MGNTQTILVTGGAGYIGSHTVLELQRRGYHVIILDNLVYGHRYIVEEVLKVPLIIGDIGDRRLLDELFQAYKIDAVIHFAAYAYVGESVKKPARYYRNNVEGTLTLLEAMLAHGVTKIVFSSTCATYGIPTILPIPENHLQQPINPYGHSKLMVERILQDFDAAYGIKFVIFRYFNAAGADPNGLIGEDHNPETHLIPLTLLAAIGKHSHISIFGTDYPTLDGTCIRDYIHVSDLAVAHCLGLEYLVNQGKSEIFNLGNENGYSVKEVIQACQDVTQRIIPVVEQPRRIGDPPLLIGSNKKAQQTLGWSPMYSLTDMVNHAWQWHQKNYLLESK
ncbi:MAG: UDP-glucose 4-epimerase GalE [Snowella sp.]|nr:UDP-glucose 4-epimerase GalE [Snowella sp.]